MSTAPQQQGGGAPIAPETPAPFASARAAGYVPTDEERSAAMWAHLFGGIASLIFASALIPVAAPLISMAMVKERGPFFLYHLNQAAIFQGVMTIVQVVLAMVVTIIGFLTCGLGFFLGFLLAVPPLVGAIYPLVVGLAANRGEWSEYAELGPRVMDAKNPLLK